MTDLPPLSADRLRSAPAEMRAAVRRVALACTDTWRGPFPGFARLLHDVGRVDLCLARLVEGHGDALRILDQADEAPRSGAYGVWASRSAGTGVRATRTAGGWHLDGEVRFASGIDVIDRALVPGWVDDETHLLFDVPAAAAAPDRSTWHTAAMDASRSFTVRIDHDATSTVGPENFYLHRPGFAVGGLGVAAVWAGGAQAVLELVCAWLRAFTPTAHQTRRLGVVEQAAWQARTAVESVTRSLPELEGDRLVAACSAARTAVVASCDVAVDEATRIVGPGGLSGNARLARTLADLTLYVRQHHVDATLEAFGRTALAERSPIG